MERGDVVYLNSASTGPLPESSRAAMEAFNSIRTEPHRISDADQLEILARSRELVAKLVNCSTDEIALGSNTGYGLNLAALALPLEEGEVVLVPGLEFPANMYPWMAILPRRGVELRVVPPRDGLIDPEAIIAALDDPRVRAVALSWVGFSTGARVDLGDIGRICRERGVFLVVDAIQALGPLTLDVATSHVDILACGAQKWLLSPWGTGFAYVHHDLVSAMEPPVVGWAAVAAADDYSRLLDYDLTWRDSGRRFELMTLPYQDFVGMNESLALLLDLGPDAVSRHIRALASRAADGATSRGMRLVTPLDAGQRAGIVSVKMDDPNAASGRLREAGVVHSMREGAIRFSPHVYNTEEEIDLAVELLDR
jgi:cysteine desulfurase / selenocysteine lyase